MKRFLFQLCIIALAMSILNCAYAEIILTGAVETGQTFLERSARGGTVASLNRQTGSYVSAGDEIASLSLSQVYAPCAGMVKVLFADEGESADDTTEKYGGVLSIEPENKYTMYADAEYAYKSIRTHLISSGQTVYMKCTANGTHRGVGRITNIDGEIFTIEATGGEFYTGETVYVYMEDDYDTADRLGKATVTATPSEYVSGTGDIVNLHVQEGDFVEKGQLLFETVGALDENGSLLPLTAGQDGYIVALHAQVNEEIHRDDPLVEICPRENLFITANVPESEITVIEPGMRASISIDLPEGVFQIDGWVDSISYLPADGDEVAYPAHIRFDSDERIVPGMQAEISIETP